MNQAWFNIRWKEIYEHVKGLQRKLIVAYNEKDSEEVHRIQQQIVRSYAGRAIAVRRVTTNSGGKTPGIDKITWKSASDKAEAIMTLGRIAETINEYKADPVRRVWIPKANGGKRPLGIPTMKDRALQALFHLAIDPIVEEISDNDSYGFRKCKSADDAICRIRTLLDKEYSPRWVLDADIEKCFDRISHKVILEKTPIYNIKPIEQWLKAGVVEWGNFTESVDGTPQGGVISPLLCNIALNGIEAVLPKKPKIHLIRYADDFIITAPTREMIEKEVKPAIVKFLNERGLRMSDEKTRTVNIEEEWIKFLGWEMKRVRAHSKLNQGTKQETVLVIKPGAKAVTRVKGRIKEIAKGGKPMEALIKELNPVVRGWTNYFRSSYHSQVTFQSLGHYLQTRLWRWAHKTHPTRSATWIKANLTHKTKDRTWNWGINSDMAIFDPSLAINAVTRPLKLGINPYTVLGEEYYNARITIRNVENFKKAVYKQSKYLCSVCGESLKGEEAIELHHIQPRARAGKYTLKNIQPLHVTCHQAITYRKSPSTESKPPKGDKP